MPAYDRLRHGARLDAADDQWQTNSQNPYDTPLSYGGWTQTRALGARIASLLHAREAGIAEEGARSQRRRSDASHGDRSSSRGQQRSIRKTKVLIHSSPFLRCVQSSLAVSAGMAQYYGNLVRLEARPKSSESGKPFPGPPRAQTLDSKAFEDKYRAKNQGHVLHSEREVAEDIAQEYERPILRIDACLGEWLSPDYYDFTTAPPPSNMMVALAKAELLRSAEPLQGAKIVEPDGSVTEYLGGDPQSKVIRYQRPRSTTLEMGDMARAMPGIGAGTLPPTPSVNDEETASRPSSSSSQKSRYLGYIPPTPTYALLHSAPIPRGYVAHARDACVDIDFQWDSMRGPQDWGDGGSFGEEWSAMHRRFRGGVSNMIDWYKAKGADFDSQDDEKLAGDEDLHADEDSDVVLVVMTHGAGCNALIGALTNQPVLMDVGMASLTMAVKKVSSTSTTLPFERPRSGSLSFQRRTSSVVDTGLSEEYEVKLSASTEHLRAGPDPLVIPQLAHPGAMPVILEHGRRSPTSTGGNTSKDHEFGGSKNSSLGSMRRTSVKSGLSRPFSNSPLITSPNSTGLWGSKLATVDKMNVNREDHLEEKAMSATNGSSPSEEGAPLRHHSIREPVSATAGSPAPSLWGPTSGEDSKRRYTVGMRR